MAGRRHALRFALALNCARAERPALKDTHVRSEEEKTMEREQEFEGITPGEWRFDKSDRILTESNEVLLVSGVALPCANHPQSAEAEANGRALAAFPRLLRERDAWRKALTELTPGGSEFIDDPVRCKQFARDARDSEHRQLLKAARERDEAREENRKLLELLAKLDTQFSSAARNTHPGLPYGSAVTVSLDFKNEVRAALAPKPTTPVTEVQK
jgi:hypothetical protein